MLSPFLDTIYQIKWIFKWQLYKNVGFVSQIVCQMLLTSFCLPIQYLCPNCFSLWFSCHHNSSERKACHFIRFSEWDSSGQIILHQNYQLQWRKIRSLINIKQSIQHAIISNRNKRLFCSGRNIKRTFFKTPSFLNSVFWNCILYSASYMCYFSYVKRIFEKGFK